MATECQFAPERRQEIRNWYSRSVLQSPHELLGVEPHPDPDALRSAFVQLAKRFHPDTLGPGADDVRREMHAVFLRINEAFQILRSRTTEQPRTAPASTTPPAPFRPPVRVTEAPPPSAAAEPGRDGPSPARRLQAPGWRRDRVESALAQAAQLLAQRETEAAIEALHEVLTLALGAQRRQVRASLAEAYLSERRFRRNALSLLDQAVREDPGDAQALAILGRLYRREGLLSRAESMLRRAVRADPENVSALADLRAVRADLVRRRVQDPVAHNTRAGLVERILAFGRTRR